MDAHEEHLELARRGIDRTFRRHVDALHIHIQQHESPPSLNSDDEKERKLARFLYRQRMIRKGPPSGSGDSARDAYLDKMVPGWDDPSVLRHTMMYNRLHDFIKANRRLPRRRADSVAERRLWESLKRLRLLYASGSLDVRSINLAEQIIPCCLTYEPWQQTVAKLSHFHAEHGRWPDPDAADRQERLLGKFLEAKRTGWGSSSAQRFLDLVLGDWRGTSDTDTYEYTT